MSFGKNLQFLRKMRNKIFSCFEKEYVIDGIDYMDVYIAVE